ncbi:hypothetical protein C2845_PM01G08360 [Panicum miliaceum]|uniref:Uncharacterized protein n=1 Tax=Panicum miliaceum TaxID=4540 RepID=A0A3L6TG81_PANMI|nr:hypothetical protein C2845_PM01G08360 [Panicum miliaceum]
MHEMGLASGQILVGSADIIQVDRKDLKVALIYAVLFCFLMVSCYVALYLKWFKLSAMFVIFGILLPIRRVGGCRVQRQRSSGKKLCSQLCIGDRALVLLCCQIRE